MYALSSVLLREQLAVRHQWDDHLRSHATERGRQRNLFNYYQEGLKLNASEPRPPTNLSENLICSKVYKFSAIFLKNRELI